MGVEKNNSGQMNWEANHAVEIFPITNEAVSIPVGVAGAVVEFQIKKFPIRSILGGSLGGPGDSSLVLTATAFTREVAFGTKDADMANGDYYINYLTGGGKGKKADTSTTMTVAYNVVTEKTAGDALTLFDADGDNTAQACKTTPGQLIGFSVENINSADAFIQFHALPTGSVSVGSSTPK